MTRRIIAAFIIILAIIRARGDRQLPPAIMASREGTRSKKRLFERLLPWLEAATSIATVTALFLTYQALKDSSAQLEVGRQQITYAREAAQPAFQIKFFDKAGVECALPVDCDPARITIQQIGAAEQVNYSVNERLLFSTAPNDPYLYLSPWLNTWGPQNDPTIWALSGPNKLPRDLETYLDASIVYIIDAFYTDIFGVEHQKRWVLSPDFSSLKEERESVINKCDNSILKNSSFFNGTTYPVVLFEHLIRSAYKVKDLAKESRRMLVQDKTLKECLT